MFQVYYSSSIWLQNAFIIIMIIIVIIILLLLLIINLSSKPVGEWYTPNQSVDPAPKYQHIEIQNTNKKQ